MAHQGVDPASLTIADAQRDMRLAFYGGAPGVLTSAVAWLIATVVCLRLSPERAIWALFIGGMFIHPVAVLLAKAMGRPGRAAPGNPLVSLAMASTFWMILSLPLAYAAAMVRIEWFFPAMLFVIGGRYLVFSTIYGTRIYWVFGAALVFAGWMLGRSSAAPAIAVATGAAIEAVFAFAIFHLHRSENKAAPLIQSA